MTPLYPTPSPWRLKVKRAQLHLVEFEREARRYIESHPYRAVNVRQPKSKPNHWVYKLEMTTQPDPMLAVILGEFFHSLRSALDNVVVACLPRSSRGRGSFPLNFENIWERDSGGAFVSRDDCARKRFDTALKGIDPKARAIIERTQPYNMPANMALNPFGFISRLDNADKHRGLIVVGTAGRNVEVEICARNRRGTYRPTNAGEVVEDDTELAQFDWPDLPYLTEAEVQVKVTATAAILIHCADGNGSGPQRYETPTTLIRAIRSVRSVLTALEPFVQDRKS